MLTPAQRNAADDLSCALAKGEVLVLEGDTGYGRTTILERLHAAEGGVLLGAREFMTALERHSPPAMEEAFQRIVEEALPAHKLLIIDDLHLLTNVVNGYSYPLRGLMNVAFASILDRAAGHKLVFAVDSEAPGIVRRRAYVSTIEDFTPADYECLCRAYLSPEKADRLDFAAIHRFAPKLNGHHLRNACTWLAEEAALDTETFLEYIRTHNLASNVDLEEVAPVDWKDLKGVDDVIRALEAKIALPLENDALAAQLGLKPKRGVLLAGPPGTGKTTIGRALARRLKGKFFLIDGKCVAGSEEFYCKVTDIFEEAKRNAPSVVFIDDTDVIFENKDDHGFYRYLLTIMDGLESASSERVCVMMTAMNVSSLPPAMVRSGRVELWLETRLPDDAARAEILRERLAPLPHPLNNADVCRLAAASAALTGADLKAVVEDGKLLYAHDATTGAPPRPGEEYFLEAIATIRANQRNYGRRKSTRPPGAAAVGFITE
jgi:ATP-dependent 26S proteasome regulatory subunit